MLRFSDRSLPIQEDDIDLPMSALTRARRDPAVPAAGGSTARVTRAVAMLVLAVTAHSWTAHAEERPLWEFGVGPAGLYLPDYRGSDQGRTHAYPFPLIVYRGEHFKSDREGVRGILFESDRVQLDVSFNATPPVDSGRNQARQGMPDLDATIEVGPMLGIVLARDREIDYTYRLRLRLPARAVVATDFRHLQTQGWVTNPHLNLDLRPAFLGGRWNVGLNAGPIFATQKYHQYFYGVAPQFATLERPAYDARGGYSGTTFLASISRHIGQVWVGAFLRYDLLAGASFEPSPLVRQNSALAGGIAIAWIFSASGTKVETPD